MEQFQVEGATHQQVSFITLLPGLIGENISCNLQAF